MVGLRMDVLFFAPSASTSAPLQPPLFPLVSCCDRSRARAPCLPTSRARRTSYRARARFHRLFRKPGSPARSPATILAGPPSGLCRPVLARCSLDRVVLGQEQTFVPRRSCRRGKSRRSRLQTRPPAQSRVRGRRWLLRRDPSVDIGRDLARPRVRAKFREKPIATAAWSVFL